MIKKMIIILAILLIGGCSINASFTCGQSYLYDYELVTVSNSVELAEFWEKIDGEMNPESIWGDAETDQEKCQAEANYMAKYRKFCHVGPCIGRFEGIGWSKSCAFPNTCVPSKRMRLTGDAVAITSSGITIRVRSWR